MPNVDVWRDGTVDLPRRGSAVDDVADLTSYQGLSSAEASRRRRRDGANILPKPPSRPAWRVLAGQLFHFFALMLWGAAVLASIAGMPQLTVAIVVIVIVNGLFAFAQKHRAERAALVRIVDVCRAVRSGTASLVWRSVASGALASERATEQEPTCSPTRSGVERGFADRLLREPSVAAQETLSAGPYASIRAAGAV